MESYNLWPNVWLLSQFKTVLTLTSFLCRALTPARGEWWGHSQASLDHVCTVSHIHAQPCMYSPPSRFSGVSESSSECPMDILFPIFPFKFLVSLLLAPPSNVDWGSCDLSQLLSVFESAMSTGSSTWVSSESGHIKVKPWEWSFLAPSR